MGVSEAKRSETRRTVPELIENIQSLTKEIQDLYCLDKIPWVVGYSGGKDSTCVLQLIWNAISNLPSKKRTKPIYVLTTDTLVENPFVALWVRRSLQLMEEASTSQDLPFNPHLLTPEVKDTFWVSLIGKGYPAPRRTFRWCTERLKIWPSNRFIQEIAKIQGEITVVLGTRTSESSRRASVMAERQIGQVSERLNSNSKSLLYRGQLPNSFVYSPIADWRDDEVWLYLMQFSNPWGNSNKDLFSMYRGATEDNECPFVIDTSTPSCGDSRFGCWVCTLVNQDKSMMAMIQNDEEKAWMQPLLDLRNQLDVHRDHDRRDFRRMTGKVQLFECKRRSGGTEIIPIPGPYTRYWREEWLRRLLQAQVEVRKNAPPEMKDIQLISQLELSEIRRIWRDEKHEFDDTLPRIYFDITGQKFQDPRPTTNTTPLGPDEWAILQDLCQNDPMHLELVAKLLNTERKYQTMSRRNGIYKALEQCFETSARPQLAAIDHAHDIRDIKQAVETRDVPQVKQLWAKMKFGGEGVEGNGGQMEGRE